MCESFTLLLIALRTCSRISTMNMNKILCTVFKACPNQLLIEYYVLNNPANVTNVIYCNQIICSRQTLKWPA